MLNGSTMRVYFKGHSLVLEVKGSEVWTYDSFATDFANYLQTGSPKLARRGELVVDLSSVAAIHITRP
jgi:hypothetical protein